MSNLPRRALTVSALPLVMLDAAAVAVSFWLALAFRFDGQIPLANLQFLLLALPAVVAIFILSNLEFGLYAYVWRYISAAEVLTIGIASLVSTLLLISASMLQANRLVPLSVVGL